MSEEQVQIFDNPDYYTRFGTGGVAPSPDVLEILQRGEFLTPYLEAEALVKASKARAGRPYKRLDVRGLLKSGWVVTDQKTRGTCTAFATTACVEILIAQKYKKREKLSPEFLYWNMRNDLNYRLDPEPPGYDLGGTKLSQAADALQDLGVCSDDLAPYQTASLFSKRKPSPAAFKDAKTRKIQRAKYWDYEDSQPLPEGKVEAIYQELENGRPCAAGVPMFQFAGERNNNWWNTASVNSGVVLGPNHEINLDRDFETVSAHVFCITGFQPDKNAAGGGWFVFRNSWDSRFGKFPPHSLATLPEIPQPGYGAISADYIECYCWEFLSLDLVK